MLVGLVLQNFYNIKNTNFCLTVKINLKFLENSIIKNVL